MGPDARSARSGAALITRAPASALARLASASALARLALAYALASRRVVVFAAVFALALALALPATSGCVTFAGEQLDATGGADSSTSTTTTTTSASGGGGAAPANDPDAYLPVLDAAELCAIVGECPLLGASVAASLGVPIVAFDAADRRIDLSYSACLDWLASPLAAGRVGFEEQREVLYDLVPSSCATGLSLLAFEVMTQDDERCAGAPAQRCEGDVLVDCAASVSRRCSAPPYSAATTCLETGDETARCGIAHTCGEPPSCDGSFSVTCESDVLSAFDCATVGLGCSASEPGACGGQSGAASCEVTAFGQQGCSPDGERASLCLGGLVGETDCDAVGLACVGDGAAARCGDPAAELAGQRCSPDDPDVDVCRGDVLQACIGGGRVDVDCASLGRACKGPLSLGGLTLSARCGLAGL